MLRIHLAVRLQIVEHGHSCGDSVFDLVVDERALIIHDGIAEFDTAVHWARVHEVEAAFFDFFEAGIGDAVEFVVFADGGEEGCVLTFHLDAEEIDDVGVPFHCFVVIGEAVNAFGSVFW